MSKETRSSKIMARATLLLTLLWLAFVVRGVWYCALLPPWEGYDEPFHFAAVQEVAAGRGLPRADTRISLEVQKSLHLLPLPWELQFQAIPQPLITYDDYWKLSPAEQQLRIDAVGALSPEDGNRPATEPILNYESQQTPLYYWLFAAPLRWMSSLPFLSRLFVMRLSNVLLASAAVPLAYWTAKRVLCSESQALGVTAIIVLLPELMINLARVGNENLALVCYTAMLAAAMRAVSRPQSWRAWLLMGAALGCGLLSKSYVLSAVPGILAVAVASFGRNGDASPYRPNAKSITARVAAALTIAAAIASPWYLRVHRATGSWTGITTDSTQSHVSLLQKLAAVTQVNWRSGFLSILVSHVWFGAWSFLRLSDRVYKLAFVLIAVGMAGVVVRLLRRRTSSAQRRDILVLSVFYLCFWLGLLYHVLVTFLSLGVSSSTGWYLYAAVAAEIVLVVWGLQAFLPAHLVIPFLAISAAGLDLYGTHALLMPYYTGLTSHQQGTVSPALVQAILRLPEVFTRLSQIRPEWIEAPALVGSWIAYWVVTVGTVLMIVTTVGKRPADA